MESGGASGFLLSRFGVSLIIVIVIVTVSEFSSHDIVSQLNDGFSIGIDTFDTTGQGSARCQIQVLQGVTRFEESRQWFQADGCTADVEFPKQRKEQLPLARALLSY